jgi:hypothetical protein
MYFTPLVGPVLWRAETKYLQDTAREATDDEPGT